jgi:hypothetical protein
MMYSGFEIMSRGIVVAAVAASMALFRKLFPAAKSNPIIGKMGMPALDERFLPLKWKVIGAMVAVAIAFALGSWRALSGLNGILAQADGPAALHLFPQPAIWWFFPGFGALSLSWEITLQIWALFGDRDQVNLFSDWSNQSTKFWGGGGKYAGMDSRKVLRWLSLVIALPIGVFTLLAVNMHATIGFESIRDCGYAFKPCNVFPLADVRRITAIEGYRVKDGTLDPQAGLVVDFLDGRRWSSADWGDFKKTVDPALASFLTNKTGLPLESATTEKDIPALSNQIPTEAP